MDFFPLSCGFCPHTTLSRCSFTFGSFILEQTEPTFCMKKSSSPNLSNLRPLLKSTTLNDSYCIYVSRFFNCVFGKVRMDSQIFAAFFRLNPKGLQINKLSKFSNVLEKYLVLFNIKPDNRKSKPISSLTQPNKCSKPQPNNTSSS